MIRHAPKPVRVDDAKLTPLPLAANHWQAIADALEMASTARTARTMAESFMVAPNVRCAKLALTKVAERAPSDYPSEIA